jgi:hypothetical protein
MHRLALLSCLPLLTASSSAAERWQLHVGYSGVSGLEIGCAVPAPADPSTAARTDRDYDDGFNRVDATNNMGDGAGGPLPSRTGYFAFERDDQVDLTAGTLTLSSISAATDGKDASRDAADTQGINIGLRCDLFPGTDRWHFGLSADLDWHGGESTTVAYSETVQARRLADRYQLGGVVPQRAPYTGHYTPQPGDQRIGDIPTRSIGTVAASLSGTQTIEHEVTLGRLGLWCDRKLGDRLTLSLEAGLAAGWIDAQVALADTLAVNSSLSSTRAADASGSVNPFGWYAGARLHVSLSERWGLAAAYSMIDLGEDADGGVTFDASALALANLQLGWRF